MQSGVNTFIFDCFGVVCNPVLNGWYKDNMLKRGLIDENIHELFGKFDLGIASEDDVLKHFLTYDGINLTKEKLREDIDAYLKLDENLVNIILRLKNKGYKTVLLSNANHTFFERKVYTAYPEFKSYFNEVVISSEIGLAKPDTKAYLYTLNKINSKPEESLFIDDSKVNVDAAEKIGIKGYLYTDSQTFIKYLEILNLSL